MNNVIETILKNATGNVYFFVMDQNAEAINNSSPNLSDLILKAIPIANIINRHINIYAYCEEGINFVCRVLPGGEISLEKMVDDSCIVTAETLTGQSFFELYAKPNTGSEMIQIASVLPEDITAMLQDKIVANLLTGMITEANGIITKPFHRKLRDKKVLEKESEEQGFEPGNDAFEDDDEVNISLKD